MASNCHCEEVSDEAILLLYPIARLLRFARNDDYDVFRNSRQIILNYETFPVVTPAKSLGTALPNLSIPPLARVTIPRFEKLIWENETVSPLAMLIVPILVKPERLELEEPSNEN